MKLIIDIPEDLYKAIIHKEFDAKLVVNEMRKSIANGTPLDKIRAEITEYAMPDFEYHGCGGSQKIVELEDVLEIIDKYRK